jgi:hypothetical protein
VNAGTTNLDPVKIPPVINFTVVQDRTEIDHACRKISIRFADEQPLYFQIKHSMKTPLQNIPLHPALFQIAARLETHTCLPISKSLPAELKKVCSLPGLDSEKPNLFERSKNIFRRAVYSSKNKRLNADA